MSDHWPEFGVFSKESVRICDVLRHESGLVRLARTVTTEELLPHNLKKVRSNGHSCVIIAEPLAHDFGLSDYGYINHITSSVHTTQGFMWSSRGKNLFDCSIRSFGPTHFDTVPTISHLVPVCVNRTFELQNTLGSVIEASELRFPEVGDTVREYHAVTRGWILGEILRRVDPAGRCVQKKQLLLVFIQLAMMRPFRSHRTLGEFMRDEVAQPLRADLYIGIEDSSPLLSRQVRYTYIMCYGPNSRYSPVLQSRTRIGQSKYLVTKNPVVNLYVKFLCH